MNYAQLEAATAAFTTLINNDLGREAIKPMTLQTPRPPPDELHFFQLVVWCYGFFFEAATDVLKECKALMKQNAPERTNRYDLGTRTINNLRTYKVHNLPPSKGNDLKRAAAQAWLAEFNSESDGIARAAERLCEMALAILDDVILLWKSATKDPDDASELINRVKASLDNTWPAHELHQMVLEIAEDIQLTSFDAKTFCDNYIEDWRRIGGCFLERDSAGAGIKRAIRNTMLSVFGLAASKP
jgi:hypothetical protein